MIEVLAGLGLLFWAIAALVFIAAVVSVENEQFAITTPVVVLGVAGLIWLSGVDVLGWLSHNIATIAVAVAVYLVTGVVYGVIRYVFYVHKIADRLAEWAHARDISPNRLTVSEANGFASYAGLRSFPLKVADSKGRITFWMLYWPFSAPWTLINEPVKRFYSFAYGRVAGLLQGIADRAFNGVEIVDHKPAEPKGLTGGRRQLNG